MLKREICAKRGGMNGDIQVDFFPASRRVEEIRREGVEVVGVARGFG